MGTNNKVHSRAFTAWVSLHRYGFIQTVFVVLLAASLIWMYFYGEPYSYTERGFFSLMSGYVPAFLFPFICTVVFVQSTERKYQAFHLAVLFGYLSALSWCAYWGISYVFPIAAAALATVFYRKIRPDDKATKTKTLFGIVIGIWLIAAFVFAVGFSYLQYTNTLKYTEYTQQALKMPTVKAIDCKDGYIYTEEYGVEKVYNYSNPIPAGSLIHRLPVDEESGDIVVVVE